MCTKYRKFLTLAKIPLLTSNMRTNSIPVSYHPTATHLTAFLNITKNFEVKIQELKYKGKRIFQSYFSQLLDGVVRFKNPSVNSKVDIDWFVSLLRQEGYPVTQLGYVKKNITGKSEMQGNSSSSVGVQKRPPNYRKQLTDSLQYPLLPKRKQGNQRLLRHPKYFNNGKKFSKKIEGIEEIFRGLLL